MAVIQIQLGNEDKVEKTRTYRDIIKAKQIGSMTEGFMAHRHFWRWGRLVELRGSNRTTLREFGKVPESLKTRKERTNA